MLRKLLLVFCLVCGCLQVAAQGKLSNVKVEDADGKLVEISSLVNGKPFIMVSSINSIYPLVSDSRTL